MKRTEIQLFRRCSCAKRTLLLAIFTLFVASLSAQSVRQDDSYRMGKLKNGLTYYIRHNAKEPGLAEFYIAQRVGSILRSSGYAIQTH